MLKKKAQLAYEFILLFFFLTVFFTAFTIIIAEGRERVTYDQTIRHIDDLGLGIQHEFYIVATMPEGFSKEFTLPPHINGQNYNFSFHNTNGQYYLLINVTEAEVFYTYDLPVFIKRTPEKMGTNTLTRSQGELYLN
jgi:hypothetical protein